jgi:S-adenosylmethionine-diacylglycerol 3-amino-3-carboxypropyl transferase
MSAIDSTHGRNFMTELVGSGALHAAVHRHSMLSSEGLQERLFSALFSGLVYPQIWEDPEVDLAALNLGSSSRVVTIASGGCNVLSYLTASPARIDAIDLNPAHVALCRLKLAAAKHLPDHRTFHRFFGEAEDRANVAVYDGTLRPHLDDGSRAYWEKRDLSGLRRIEMFARNFYRYGLLGRFIGAAHLLARLHGVRVADILRCTTLDEQRAFFENRLSPIFDGRIVKWIMRNPASLYGLGIPPAQYVSLADGRPMHEVVRERLRKLACDFPVAQNYFAQQAFGRSYGGSAALPPYLLPEHFRTLNACADRVRVHGVNLIDFLAGLDSMSVDRYVLLDAQDWMTDQQLTSLWVEITRTAAPSARVIFRTAAEKSLLPGRIPNELLARWTYHEAKSARLGKADRSSIYGGFHLYSLEAAA